MLKFQVYCYVKISKYEKSNISHLQRLEHTHTHKSEDGNKITERNTKQDGFVVYLKGKEDSWETTEVTKSYKLYLSLSLTIISSPDHVIGLIGCYNCCLFF